jgi:hypothetical protein
MCNRGLAETITELNSLTGLLSRLQAEAQMDDNWILMKMGMPETPTQGEWLQQVSILSKLKFDGQNFASGLYRIFNPRVQTKNWQF